MIFLYGNYTLSFGITTNDGSAAYLTDTAAMNDGRSGLVTSFSFSSGTAALTQYTRLITTITGTGVDNPLLAAPTVGVVGLVNVQGLPEGTKCGVGANFQRLTAGERGELSAWWILNNVTYIAPFGVDIYNDVNGSHDIVPGTTCGVGEIVAGRALYLPSLVDPTLQDMLQDPTAFSRSSGGQLWQCMRKPFRDYQQTLGRFTVSQARGGSAYSDIPSGSYTGSTIDVQTLRGYLATTPFCAVCDMPHKGFSERPAIGNAGIRFDQQFMQPNWMLARPTNPGAIVLDVAPRLVWSGLSMEEAT